jgi:hypothetical protein
MSPLNPFFLQGSYSEQRLVQDLINEQLRMYGQDVVYMPRNIIEEKTIIKEVILSKFDDSFRLEAYLSNFSGFGGQGDILSKFGVRSTDEITLIISKERYNDFIGPLISSDKGIKLSTRPQEGDLIYFPLDNSLFEVKYVEGKSPFYQLNNLYVYELRCELFEYEDEIIDTNVEEVNENIKDFGYISTLQMITDSVVGASATIRLSENQIASPFGKSVKKIDLIHDGTGYIDTPVVAITTASPSGVNATAVAIMTSKYGQQGKSIEKILITNPGIGYTQIPEVKIISSSGSGAIATAILGDKVLGPIGIITSGFGYVNSPTVSISTISSTGDNAIVQSFINSSGSLISASYVNAGSGYTTSPLSITFQSPIGVSTGSYLYNEIVRGTTSGTTAYVKDWNKPSRILKVSIIDGNFIPGETIVGMGTTANGSNASYKLISVNKDDLYDPYAENIQIETEADDIIDFSQSNPFGNF